MKFAKIVFLAGGVWGIVLVTPLYFLFDAMGVLYVEGRIAVTDLVIVAPDLVLGVLFTMAFAKTSVSSGFRVVDGC